MNWTTDKPKYIGYYWLTYTDDIGGDFEDRITVLVRIDSADLHVFWFGSDKWKPMEEFDCALWYGPLEPPNQKII